jgi:acyl-coenzyme A thioesterase PaaI-like protein
LARKGEFRIPGTLTAKDTDPTAHPVLYVHPDDAVSPEVAAARRATTALRRIITATANNDAPLDTLAAAADTLERVADELEPHARASRYEGTGGINLGGDNSAILESHPMMGPSNAIAPPMVITRDTDQARGTVTYSHQYEGPPGRVHGGFIAAAFDQVVGAAAALSGQVFFTGSLNVKFVAPTPLHVPLVYEATLDRVEDRRLHATGRLLADDRVTAECEGIFVTVPKETFHQAMAGGDAMADEVD